MQERQCTQEPGPHNRRPGGRLFLLLFDCHCLWRLASALNPGSVVLEDLFRHLEGSLGIDALEAVGTESGFLHLSVLDTILELLPRYSNNV